MSNEQEIFETGLLAVIQTARKAFFEGYNSGGGLADGGEYNHNADNETLQAAWEQSAAYAACIKAVETYTGKKL